MANIINILLLRITQCIRSKETVFLFVATVIIAILLSNSLVKKNEDNTNISIGFYYDENSEFNKVIFEIISTNTFLTIKKTDIKKGLEMVDSGEIAALFVLKSNASEMINRAHTNEISEVYYNEQNPLASIAQDVFAAELIKEIAILRAANYYVEAKGNNSLADFQKAYNYGKDLGKIDKHGYYIKLEAFYYSENTKNNNNENIKKIGLKELNKQVSFGIILTLISFIFLFLGLFSIKEKELNIDCRISISKLSIIQIVTAEYFSMLLAGVLFSGIVFVCSIISNTDIHKSLYMLAVILMFIVMQASIIEFLSSIAGGIYSYILGGSLLILIMAIISGIFFPVSLIPKEIAGILANIPYSKSNLQFSTAISSGNIISLKSYILFSLLFALLFNTIAAAIKHLKLRT